jgi:hypothetical protein
VAHTTIWAGRIGDDSIHDAFVSVIVISKDERRINLRINCNEKRMRCVKENQPRATVQRVAMRRAAYQILDNPKVFDDSFALCIIGEEVASALQADLRQFLAWCHHFGKTYSKSGLLLIK